jgi:ATP-dependent Clp protease ATP-binding subunit ClpA
MGRGVEDATGEPAFTSAAEHVLERARSEAAAQTVGPEHILLVLLEAREGAAVRILRQLDANPDVIRSALAS